ncbi:hypothetical protein scyTo_0023349, partial [Scyliorhinus torazame]|nr:hypothetical protein [Scyliorhinus torazame]
MLLAGRHEDQMSKVSDDRKLGGDVRCEEDAKRLQGDMN